MGDYGIKLKVGGKYALFTRPETKVERYSYDTITPSAARGILEAIHWKPAIRWVIDEIQVLKEIRFISIRRNEVGKKISDTSVKKAFKDNDISDTQIYIDLGDNRQPRTSVVLYDVEYVIKAHFEKTKEWGERDKESEHIDIFRRRARNGKCYHQPCLGTREFDAYFQLIEKIDEEPMPINETRDLGLMLLDRDFEKNMPLFFRAKIENGIIKVPHPNSREILR